MGKLQHTKLKRKIRIFCILMVVGIFMVKGSVINRVYAAEMDGDKEYTANQVTVVCPGVGSVDDVVTEWFVPFNLNPDVKEFDESYYNQLDDDSRSVYDELYGIYKDRADSEQYSLTCINNRTFINTNVDDKAQSEMRDIITPAMIALVYDHPEISWITNVKYGWSYNYSTKNKSEDGLTADLTVSNVKFYLSYTNVGTKAEMDAAVSSAKEEIGKADISTQYNKVKAIHDYLADNISYNYCAAGGTIGGIKKEYDNIQSNAYQTAYSAFYTCNNDDTEFGSGIYTVCAGYARGFKVLCDAYDIPCVYVTGTAVSSSGGGGHAWNYVQIAENWYAVDCTWDDQESKIYYDFFLTGGLEIPSSFNRITFNESHIASGKWNSNQDIEFIYPALSDKKYCEYLDNDGDGVCDTCRRIIDPGLSISLEGWTYGGIPKAPVVKAARVPDLKESDMDEKYGYTVWYKKKDEADSEYSKAVPTEAGDYTVQVVLPVRNDADFDYPTTKATAEFTILKAERHLEFDGYEGIYDGMSHGAVLLPDDVPDDVVLQYSMDDGATWTKVMPEVKNVADSGRKIRIKASKDNNYFEQNAEVTVQIQKTDVPAVVPERTIDAAYECKRVGDVSLPDNWIWENTEKELQEGEVVSGFAVYNGEDKGNYVTETIEVKVRRQSCSHPHKETRGAVPATAGQAGYTGDEYCTICNIMLAKGEVIPKPEEPQKPVDMEKPEEPLKPAVVVNHQKTQSPLGTILTDEAHNAKVKVTNSGRLENGEVVDAEVQYTKPSKSASKVTIPATVNIDGITYKVTSIAANAFKNDKKLTKVTIGGNVKTIGTNAFSGCKKITGVTIPEKVTKIGTNAFCGCKKLKTITIKSEKLKTIGKNAFKGIHKKAVFKVPGKMLSKYKKKLTSKTGFRKTMKVKKK